MNLEQRTCPTCGISYAAPDKFFESRRNAPLNDENRSWYCPNGHSLSFSESQVDKMRRERDRAVQEQARLEEQIVIKDRKIKRVKKRATAGVCQCCNRSFTNMHRHMQTKHPEIISENVVKMKKGVGS